MQLGKITLHCQASSNKLCKQADKASQPLPVIE